MLLSRDLSTELQHNAPACVFYAGYFLKSCQVRDSSVNRNLHDSAAEEKEKDICR